MNSAARAFLDTMEQGTWFARCGSPPLRPAATVASWAEAAAAGSSHAWANALIAAANAVSDAVNTTPARTERWNAVAAEAKPRCAALVMARLAASPLSSWVGGARLSPGPASDAERQALIDRAIAAPSSPSKGTLLLGNLEWVLLHAVIELELGAPGYFRRGADWLLDGHFLCGARGDLPLVY